MSAEIGDLFAAATPLFNQVNTVDLSDVISELAQASNGEGPRIASAIQEGSKLAAVPRQHAAAQLNALVSFARFSAVLAPDGPAVNGISQQENIALPVFNRDVADYQHAVGVPDPVRQPTGGDSHRLPPRHRHHPGIGDNVARVLTAQQADVGQVIQAPTTTSTSWLTPAAPTRAARRQSRSATSTRSSSLPT